MIGEPGVGKSAIVEGLALRIIQRKVSRVLFDKRVISLDMASIVAGTKYRGQFEERIKAILNELTKNPDRRNSYYCRCWWRNRNFGCGKYVKTGFSSGRNSMHRSYDIR